jgi:hypothetical protein
MGLLFLDILRILEYLPPNNDKLLREQSERRLTQSIVIDIKVLLVNLETLIKCVHIQLWPLFYFLFTVIFSQLI